MHEENKISDIKIMFVTMTYRWDTRTLGEDIERKLHVLDDWRTVKGWTTSVTRQRKMLGKIAKYTFNAVQRITKFIFATIYRKRGIIASPIGDPVLLQSATDLARKIRHRELKSFDVVTAFIKRIKETNEIFNFIVDERFEDSLQEAKLIDERIENGLDIQEIEYKQPFLGVPFTFKTSIAKKGFRYTAGLYLRKDTISDEDADVITYMKEAGAIPLASTNISELCLWWESYNTIHGRTRNPYDSNRGVGGSSGGEGCIQALGASPMGLGSDIGGSIRIPAHFNGVFGHKPTNGIGSIKGHFPYPRYPTLQSFLVIGPMSRFASDLLPIFKITASGHSADLKLDESVDISKLKYFYMEDDGGSLGVTPVDPEIKLLMNKIIKHLKESYGIEAEKLDIKDLGYAMPLWFASMKTPAGPVIGKELSGFNGKKTFKWELVKFLFGSRQHTFPVLVTGALEQLSMKYEDQRHRYFMSMCKRLKKEIGEKLGSDGVFLYPTLPTAAPYHGEPMARPFDVSYAALFNVLGYPATHCPMGLGSSGLPIGIQVAAGEMNDRLTIAVAVELEKVFGGWIAPSS